MKKLLIILISLPFLCFTQDNCGEEPDYSDYQDTIKYWKFLDYLIEWEECKEIEEEYKRELEKWKGFPYPFDENTVRKFLDKKSNLKMHEGIYRYSSDYSSDSEYTFLLLDVNGSLNGYLMHGRCSDCDKWNVGDIKFRMKESRVYDVFDVTWSYPQRDNFWNSKRPDEYFSFYSKSNGKILEANDGMKLTKIYPKSIKRNTPNKIINSEEWTANGSGIIISKSGFIVTCHHVIDGANKIEVEFILDNQVQKFNAQIVQVDKKNDLAVIQIADDKFNGVNEPPYKLNKLNSDVGTKVYAYGYPFALSIMGKEIKVTDGIISSKTGFEGDITSYQISAPIQSGNSGGPLFDDKGNLIGINSSGIITEIADNVGYSIKTNYLLNFIDLLPEKIITPSTNRLRYLPLTEQIKQITKYVVLVKVK